MKELKNKTLFWITCGGLLLIEGLSYLSYFHNRLGSVIAILVIVGTLIISFRKIEYGLLIVIAELIIGSQGYLFSLQFGTTRISLRIALWIVVMAIWGTKEIMLLSRGEKLSGTYRNIKYYRQLMAILVVLGLGALIGLLNNNDSTFYFLEAKRWFYIIILLPLLSSFKDKEDIQKLLLVSVAAGVSLVIKTLGLVYIFSHSFIPLVYDIYAWMRLNVLGEITRLPNGFSRVFMQSQIFLLPACVAFFVMLHQRLIVKKWRLDGYSFFYGLGTISTFSVIIATLSRSFWLGLIGGLFGTIFLYILAKRPTVKVIIQSVGLTVGIMIMSGLLLFSIIRFPYPKSTADVDASLLSDRATKMEAGAASRWSLLPVMWTEIIKSPIWGHGFGKTVTYFTSDPRITSTTVDGRYTTYAFEWGWFDIWLKFGLLGLLVFGWLVISMIKDTYYLMKIKSSLGMILCFSILSLVIVHFFTPYLNHPLGFGYLGIILLILQSKQMFNENIFDKASD